MRVLSDWSIRILEQRGFSIIRARSSSFRMVCSGLSIKEKTPGRWRWLRFSRVCLGDKPASRVYSEMNVSLGSRARSERYAASRRRRRSRLANLRLSSARSSILLLELTLRTQDLDSSPDTRERSDSRSGSLIPRCSQRTGRGNSSDTRRTASRIRVGYSAGGSSRVSCLRSPV